MIKKVVPFRVNFETLRMINLAGSIILYSSALLTLLIVLDRHFNFLLSNDIQQIMNSVLSFLSIIYFLEDLLQNYLFQLAEVHRRNDFLDNSLETTLADKNSEGYFSNDSLDSGVYKLGVNSFENSFFTKSLTSSMLTPMIIKSTIIILLFIFLVLFTDNVTLSILMQVALPLTILQQSIRLITLHLRVEFVFNQFKMIFSSINSPKQDSYLITNVINYESTLAWGGILLDSNIYNKRNETLSQEWEDIKAKHSIK